MTLIDRLRTGTHEQAVVLLFDCYQALFPRYSELPVGSEERHEAILHKGQFESLLYIGTPEACVGAAMMLLDDGSEFEMTNIYNVARATINMNIEGGIRYGENKCAVIALALAAAIMETKNV